MSRRSARFLVLAGLVASCKSSGARTDASLERTADYGRPTIFARAEGEHRMMRGTRALFIVADSITVGSRTLLAGYGRRRDLETCLRALSARPGERFVPLDNEALQRVSRECHYVGKGT
jgi:hypothetical protein